MPGPDPYASLDQMKEELGIKDNARDALLTRKLNAASRWVDKRCNRRFLVAADSTAAVRVFDLAGRVIDGGRTVLVDDIGDLTDLVVETGTVAGGFTAVTGYDTTVGNALAEGRAIESIYNPAGWPRWAGQHWWGGEQLRVTARWGWPEIPDDVVEATLMQAIRLFSRKDSPEGVRGSADWGLIRVSRTDPDVQDLLAPYVRQWVA